MMKKIAFIGAGRMASAIIKGLLKSKVYLPEEIVCTCGGGSSGKNLASATGIGFEKNTLKLLADDFDVVVLACKPQQANALPDEMNRLCAGSLVLSVLAGTPISRLNDKFSQCRNIVRSMPNTPSQVGAGITAYATQYPLSNRDRSTVEDILHALGDCIPVEEDLLHAVTAVSGCGPAYVFEFTHALSKAAQQAGLSEALAQKFARQTVIGSALLMQSVDKKPEILRDEVTSPGGPTAAALVSFEANGLQDIVNQAVYAAKKRDEELAKSFRACS